jgi:CDP-diacylglycerol--serine O-phosphatidyltransferase
MKTRRFRTVRRPRRRPRVSLRRGIFILPSLFTVGNMLSGFASILHAINGRLETAAWLILLAGILDGIDGRVARLAKVSSEFGKEYDSLADVVSFGVAPAILVYQWGLWGMGRWGWIAGFLFLVAGSVRLARFNVKSAGEDRARFTGLPIPGGAGALTMLVLVTPEPVVDRAMTIGVWAFVLTVSFLMVSTVPYRSYKDFNLRKRLPATAFFLFALVIAIIAVSPVPTMAILAALYLLSGPVELLLRRVRRRAPTPPGAAPEREDDDSDLRSQPDHP